MGMEKEKGNSKEFVELLRWFMHGHSASKYVKDCFERTAKRKSVTQFNTWFSQDNPGLVARGVATAFLVVPELKEQMENKIEYLHSGKGVTNYVVFNKAGQKFYNMLKERGELEEARLYPRRAQRKLRALPAGGTYTREDAPVSSTTRRARQVSNGLTVQVVRMGADLEVFSVIGELMKSYPKALDALEMCARRLHEDHTTEEVAEIMDRMAKLASLLSRGAEVGAVLKAFTNGTS